MKIYAMKTMAVLFGVMVGMFAPLPQGEAERLVAAPPSGHSTPRRAPKVIVIRQDASEQEWLAANEVRRYIYLRTGKVLPVKKGVTRGDRIVVSCKSRPFCGDLGQDLGPQQFTLKTVPGDDQTSWWVVGGDETGTLYGAYRFAEKLGVRFALDEDILPDEPLSGAWPVLDETGKPRFALRGLQPFHDFSVGPDWWNLQDYQHVLSQMAKLRMNFIGLHTYPSWNPSTGVARSAGVRNQQAGDFEAHRDVRPSCSCQNAARTPTTNHPKATSKASIHVSQILLLLGQEFAPPPAVVAAIQERRQEAGLSCLDLPASAFADPRLLSACPHCQHPLQFNPFFAAADDYAEVLRRGLEQSRREKGADHEETLAHLAALAAHFEHLGQPEAARPFAEEHARL